MHEGSRSHSLGKHKEILNKMKNYYSTNFETQNENLDTNRMKEKDKKKRGGGLGW